MKILLTNDDGYSAEGLIFLKEYFKNKSHEVYVIAPDGERSGFSSAITFNDAVRVQQKDDDTWALSGTPADCVFYGLSGIMNERPDLVLSGINHGYNIGVDTVYSGTLGAARIGAIYEIPSIAISSYFYGEELNYEACEFFLNNHFQKYYDSIKEGGLLNINLPKAGVPINGVKNTKLSRVHRYKDSLKKFDAPYQGSYLWVDLQGILYDEDENTDSGAVRNNYISVSRLDPFLGER